MTDELPALRWGEIDSLSSQLAFLGDRRIGGVGQRAHGPFFWVISDPAFPASRAGTGKSSSLAGARRALTRAWNGWRSAQRFPAGA